MPTYRIIDETGQEVTEETLNLLALRRLERQLGGIRHKAQIALAAKLPLAQRIKRYADCPKKSYEPLESLHASIRDFAEKDPTKLVEALHAGLKQCLHEYKSTIAMGAYPVDPVRYLDRVYYTLLTALSVDEQKYRTAIITLAKTIVAYPAPEGFQPDYPATQAIAQRWLSHYGEPTQTPPSVEPLVIGICNAAYDDNIEAIPTKFSAKERKQLGEELAKLYRGLDFPETLATWLQQIAKRAILDARSTLQGHLPQKSEKTPAAK